MRLPAIAAGLLILFAQPASCLKVAVFAADDVEPTCLKAIEKVLRDAGVPFDEVKGKDIVDGTIVERYDVLILPGGAYSERVVHHPRFIEGLKEFARAGGKIVGICAGAITLVKGGLVRAKVEGAGLGVGKVTLELERDPLTEGLPDRLEVTYINGPVMRSQGAKVVARYAGGIVSRGDAILVDRYGKGEVIAIGPHPCHDERGNVNTQGAKLLLNALGVKKRVKSGKVEGEGWFPTPVPVAAVILGLVAALGVRGLISRRGTGVK
ncbi:DJ-1/PfpI family protein [Methanopyrus kandleri]|uniref:Predicted protease or amidase n=2 Tax=Methanopyrus kandleri TaxID=2320 RepID=Q8TWA7_METKA|nr:DJ-1/PfpI family protein [Methanopyrus kandleri]AAM02342.1 Predicted protease or amidase [Methanopyrus kandleri AV19]HII69763.1 DJ-1/PfpI family protein [Methanopyrus kandleri]